jgi:hypothetical protein
MPEKRPAILWVIPSAFALKVKELAMDTLLLRISQGTLPCLPVRRSFGRRKQLSLRRGAVTSDVIPHVLPQDLRGGLPFRSTHLDEFLADFPLDPQPQPGVFGFEWHAVSVTPGYTRVHPI